MPVAMPSSRASWRSSSPFGVRVGPAGAGSDVLEPPAVIPPGLDALEPPRRLAGTEEIGSTGQTSS